MITLFRNFARSKWAIGLLALVALSLLITGGAQTDVFASLGPRHVIDAGSRSMGQQEFRQEFERARTSVQQQAGRGVSIQEMVDQNLHTRFLESRTEELGFLAWAWDAGIRPGKELILKQIREVPAFFNSITGAFDQQQYVQALAQQNMTPQQAEASLRDEFAVNHFGAGLFAGARAPRIYGALVAGQALESRDGRWFTVTQAMVGEAPAPTDAQLTAFINENAEQLRSPEFRMVSLVLFSSPSDAAATVTEERIAERFEFRRPSLSQPETRTFVTLSAPTREAAQRVAAALNAGQSPQEAGRTAGIEPQTYTDTPQSALPDPAVAAAVFGLAPNAVSEPIQGRVGFTVARVSAVTPGRAVSLADVRDDIVAELREEDALGATFERVQAYERARQAGKTLADAATEVGARVVQLPPFTREGRLPDGQALTAPPPVIENAWSLTKGGESEVIEAGRGQYFVLRLDDIRPAALPELAEIREPLAQQWVARENNRRLMARTEELAGRVRAGEDIAAVAASANATLTTRAGLQQNQTAQAEVGQGVLRGLFGQGRGQVFSGPTSQTAFVVGRVDAIHAATPVLAAPIAEQVRPRITQELTNELVQAAFTAAARRTGARNDPARALEALGVTPTATPAAPAQ